MSPMHENEQVLRRKKKKRFLTTTLPYPKIGVALSLPIQFLSQFLIQWQHNLCARIVIGWFLCMVHQNIEWRLLSFHTFLPSRWFANEIKWKQNKKQNKKNSVMEENVIECDPNVGEMGKSENMVKLQCIWSIIWWIFNHRSKSHTLKGEFCKSWMVSSSFLFKSLSFCLIGVYWS